MIGQRASTWRISTRWISTRWIGVIAFAGLVSMTVDAAERRASAADTQTIYWQSPSIDEGAVEQVSHEAACDASHCDASHCDDYLCDDYQTFASECCSTCDRHPLEQLSFLAAIDGAKQPQDFGVNADLGARFRVNYSAPLVESYGLGYQVGTAVNWTDNAVRVFELIGEDTSRFQSHTTVGLFQRIDQYGWGLVYDHLFQDGFDKTTLGQIRGQVSLNVTDNTQVGLMGRFRAFDDTANFLGSPVTLRSINQGSFYFRHFFETGVQSTWWFGLVDEHGESNAVTGPAPARGESFVLGADFIAPLNDSLALYGETNLITPADTGTVDAFFGVIWYPFTSAKTAHRQRFSPMMPVAAATSLAVDLLP